MLIVCLIILCEIEESCEASRVVGFELHGFSCAGMVEVESEGVQCQPVEWVESVAVLVIASHGIAQVLHVDTNLVLPACLEPHLCQGVAPVGCYAAIVRDGFLPAVVCGAAIGDVSFVVLEPGVDGAAFLRHLSAEYGDIASVIDDVVPVFLELLPDVEVLGINHQAACVAVEPVDDVSRAGEVAAAEVLVEDGLDAVLARCRGHAEDAFGLLDDDEVLVLVDYADIWRLSFHFTGVRRVCRLRVGYSTELAFKLSTVAILAF